MSKKPMAKSVTEYSFGPDAIISAIRNEYDLAVLSSYEEALRDQRKALARRLGYAIKPGDEVKFNTSINPRYLAGLSATVVRVSRESVTVKCPDDERYGKFRLGQRVRVPLTLIAA